MGLFNKKNIDKAKALAEKNAAKIASGVDKATDAVDKKTGGKYSDKLRKVDGAAKKFAGRAGKATDTTTTSSGTSSTGTTGTPNTGATGTPNTGTTPDHSSTGTTTDSGTEGTTEPTS